MSYVYKKKVKLDKKQQLIYSFIRVEASKVIEFFKKITWCDTNLLLKPFFDINNVIFGL